MTTKRPRGRPPAPADQKPTEWFRCRVSAARRDVLQGLLAEVRLLGPTYRGMTQPEALIEALREYLRLREGLNTKLPRHVGDLDEMYRETR